MQRLYLLISACVRRTYDALTTPPGWPIAALLLASMTADVIFLRPIVGRDPMGDMVPALYFSQVALAAIWLAMGRSRFSLRIVLTFFVWLAWVCFTSKTDRQTWAMSALMAGAVAVRCWRPGHSDCAWSASARRS